MRCESLESRCLLAVFSDAMIPEVFGGTPDVIDPIAIVDLDAGVDDVFIIGSVVKTDDCVALQQKSGERPACDMGQTVDDASNEWDVSQDDPATDASVDEGVATDDGTDTQEIVDADQNAAKDVRDPSQTSDYEYGTGDYGTGDYGTGDSFVDVVGNAVNFIAGKPGVDESSNMTTIAGWCSPPAPAVVDITKSLASTELRPTATA